MGFPDFEPCKNEAINKLPDAIFAGALQTPPVETEVISCGVITTTALAALIANLLNTSGAAAVRAVLWLVLYPSFTATGGELSAYCNWTLDTEEPTRTFRLP